MDIGRAMEAVKRGYAVSREGGPRLTLFPGSKGLVIYETTAESQTSWEPWIVREADLYSDKWELA